MKTFEYDLYCGETLYRDRVQAESEEASRPVFLEMINEQWDGYFDDYTFNDLRNACVFLECNEINTDAERIRDAAPELLAALEAVLLHVEDEDAQRAGSQCTLCAGYRKMIRDTINKAKGITS